MYEGIINGDANQINLLSSTNSLVLERYGPVMNLNSDHKFKKVRDVVSHLIDRKFTTTSKQVITRSNKKRKLSSEYDINVISNSLTLKIGSYNLINRGFMQN